MNVIAFIVALVIFCLILSGVIWIGFRIVLPIVILCVLLSAAGALSRKFHLIGKGQPDVTKQKNQRNQVIDVEFEEIKQ